MFDLSDMQAHVELRAGIGYEVMNKGSNKVSTKFVAMKKDTFFNTEIKSDDKFSSKIGAGVGINTGKFSANVNYDMSLAKKFMGHQGTFKVRVDF